MNEINQQFFKRFQRSIRIDSDYNDLSIVDTFVSSETANKTIIDICDHINNGQQAFTWTGAYGSGKSSLALILHGILSHKNTQLYKKSVHLINDKCLNSINKTFRNFSNKIIVPIVAGKNNLENLILEELSKITGVDVARRDLFETLKVASKNYQIIIFVDELGKYLEYASSTSQDIMFLQNLAELCNRSNGAIIFIGILHQAFSEYSKSADQAIRDEWSKIQGRFVDLPINVSAEEQMNLMAYSLSYDNRSWVDFDPNQNIYKFVGYLKEKNGWLSENNLLNLFPLNPITAFLISAISKRSFAQNQKDNFQFFKFC